MSDSRRSTRLVPVIGAPAEHHGIRVSTHLFHDRGQVEDLVEVCWNISRAMG